MVALVVVIDPADGPEEREGAEVYLPVGVIETAFVPEL